MPIAQSHMNGEQNAAVVQAVRYYLRPERVVAREELPSINPIVRGMLLRSRSGATWVSFSLNPDLPLARWYRYIDLPDSGHAIVIDEDGRPLGNSDGPLMLGEHHRQWWAQTINTGWQPQHELLWLATACNDV